MAFIRRSNNRIGSISKPSISGINGGRVGEGDLDKAIYEDNSQI